MNFLVDLRCTTQPKSTNPRVPSIVFQSPRSPFSPPLGLERLFLVVLSVGLSLGVEHAGPVLLFEGKFGVDVDLDAKVGSLLLDGVGVDAGGLEETAEELKRREEGKWSRVEAKCQFAVL